MSFTMKFTINDNIEINAWTYETRYSWGHKATLSIDGETIKEYKIVYQNRTWERWPYESMLHKIADSKDVNAEQSEAIKQYIKTHPYG